ncbi:MAG: type IV pilus secretin PilQ [Gammaproteobacteria bacterium]|nr:type IV pilus secretin PilQ [Gammaproteobacteria bacterium]MCH9754411.1 type IV pilus secretin PilQ [Gammaproteobacteria bacterium]
MLKILRKKIVLIYVLMLAFNCKLFANENISNKQEDNTISLTFHNIKIRSALQYLSELHNKNLVIDDKIKGKFSIYLHHINWDQALDTILQTQGLSKRSIANGWFITTSEQLLKQDRINSDIQKKKKDLSPLFFKIVQIHYRKASDISKLLKDKTNTLLSTHGSVSIDNPTNSLWIKDSAEQLKEIVASIKELDKPIGQILIEARIVSIDQNKEKELGAQFGSTQTHTVNKLLKSQLRSKVSSHNNGLLQYLTMDLPITGSHSINGAAFLGLRLMHLGQNTFLDLELAALESEGAAEVISTPHLITADQQTAFIEAGAEIPYQEKASSGGTNVIFKKAVLSLKVTPRIMPDECMILDLKVSQDQPSSIMTVAAPTIKARGIKTQVIVKNGETIVLGGIYEYSQSKIEQRVPFLGTLPMIGRLFRLTRLNNRRSELLIFLTPTLLKY